MSEGRTAWPVEPDGWYVEPEWATKFLLDREELHGPVWDPCCGMGNIVKACLHAGLEAWGTDLRERDVARFEPWWAVAGDFLGCDDVYWWEQWRAPPRSIVMNPPYGHAVLAEAFIRHALTLDVEKVCAFVNAKFLFGKGRATGLFRDHPPLQVYPVTPRPSCPPGQVLLAGGKASGGVENFAWVVWQPGRTGGATHISWG